MTHLPRLTDAHAEFLAEILAENERGAKLIPSTPRERQMARELVAHDILAPPADDGGLVAWYPTPGIRLVARALRART